MQARQKWDNRVSEACQGDKTSFLLFHSIECTQATFVFIPITVCLGVLGKLVRALADRYVWLEGLVSAIFNAQDCLAYIYLY